MPNPGPFRNRPGLDSARTSDVEASSQSPPDDGELPLSFEACAELSARLLGLGQGERLQFLDEREVNPDDWQRCDRHYSLALADDIVRERMERADLYGSKCAAEIERRKDAAARPASEPETARVPPEPDADLKLDSGALVEPARVEPPHVPSYLQANAAPLPSPFAQPAVLSSKNFAGTAMAFELPTALRQKVAAAALPFPPGAGSTLATAWGRAGRGRA